MRKRALSRVLCTVDIGPDRGQNDGPLSGWAETLGWFNPLAHVVNLFRGLTLGELEWSHAGDLVWLIVATVPVYLLAIWSLRRRLIQ